MRWMLCAGFIWGCSGGDTDKPPRVNPNVRFEEALHTVEVSATTGLVRVAASSSSAVLISFTPDAGDDDWQHSIIDGKLVMGAICGDGSIGCGGDFDIELPPNTDVVVTTTSGPVELVGLGGDVDVVSESGTILGEAMGAVDLITRTVDAGTNLFFALPPDEIDILGGGGGGIGITVPPGNYRVDVTTLGDVTIEGGVVDGNAGPDLILESGNGSVRVSGG